MTNRLKKILSYCRAHDSHGEKAFIREVIKKEGLVAMRDERGEVMAWMHEQYPKQDSKILWCCHIDTVHPKDAPERQIITHDADTGLIYKKDDKPLGADDGAGVWLLLEMIRHGVPGTYLFHRGEERGGIGSNWIARNHKEWLKTFNFAIAFDRRGTDSIITEQGPGETASVAFAESMAALLNAHGMEYEPDPTGIYTDTANYADVIAECTNLSVGYENEHTANELLDVEHLNRLLDAIVKVFGVGKEGEKSLVVKRTPGDYGSARWGKFRWGKALSYGNGYTEFEPDWPRGSVATDQYPHTLEAIQLADRLMDVLQVRNLNDAYTSISYKDAREACECEPETMETLVESIEKGEYEEHEQDHIVAIVESCAYYATTVTEKTDETH